MAVHAAGKGPGHLSRLTAASTTLNPLTLSPSIWYSPSDATTVFKDAGTTQAAVGEAVQQLNDKSGNSKNISQATSTKRPLLATVNGKRCLDFDGTDDFMNGASLTLSQPFTLCVAALIENTSAQVGNLLDGATTRSIFGATTSNNYREFSGSTAAYGTRDTTAHAMIATFNGTSSTIQIDSTASGSLSPGSNGIGTTIIIGADNSLAGQFFNGQVFEWMIIPRVLTAGETTSMVAYLKNQAGV